MMGEEAAVHNGRLSEEGGDMPLHYSRNGYTFRADQQGLAIEPGPEPITLTRAELEQLGVIPRDDYQIPLGAEGESGASIDRMVIALAEAMKRCHGTEDAWMAQDLRRAMVVIGGLDEATAQSILDQERV
jgi:hypothetical protein